MASPGERCPDTGADREIRVDNQYPKQYSAFQERWGAGGAGP
jgi:hypothetical protein